jgi:hypothetical protein
MIAGRPTDRTIGMKSVNKKMKGEEKKIKLPKTACGVIVMSGEELLGMDFFDSPKTFSSHKQKLLQSYLLEGLKRKSEKSDQGYAQGLLKEMVENKTDIKTNALSRSVVGIRTKRLKADLLLHENRICHLTALNISERRKQNISLPEKKC